MSKRLKNKFPEDYEPLSKEHSIGNTRRMDRSRYEVDNHEV